MLFNSISFISIFLPCSLFIFYLIHLKGFDQAAPLWLIAASLFYYGWWLFPYVFLLVTSILFNFYLGTHLANRDGSRPSKYLLIFGITANLLLLGYFKYSHFLADQINLFLASPIRLQDITLPLAISFFTFQQIAFLVDSYRGETRGYKFSHYCLFISFFPQLIAGPIVSHKEMMPQLAQNFLSQFSFDKIAAGLTIFFIGLFKKVVIADEISESADAIFSMAAGNPEIPFLIAWGGVLAFTFQIYFDFSGYSDMAIGLAYMFGIRLPVNFYSPYKATSIIDFWRRWHITLSRFFRNYLYIPLGGNGKGKGRHLFNLMTTMLLGGLWHGASWTFVFWGFLNGFYLTINHAWRNIRRKLGHDLSQSTFWGRTFSRGFTFLAIVVAWVFFKAENFQTALIILKGMAGLNDFIFSGINPNDPGVLTESFIITEWRSLIVDLWPILMVLLLIVWFTPNTQEIMSGYSPAINIYKDETTAGENQHLRWEPNWIWAVIISLIAAIAINNIAVEKEFLYFQF